MDTSRTNLPAALKPVSPRWLPSLRGAMRAEWETVGNRKRQIWTLPTPLTANQLRELRAWQSEVTASLSLRAGDEDRKAKSVARLYAVLASDRVPDEYLQVRMETWLDVLLARPAWEIEEAAMMWIRGDLLAEGENRSFVPKPAELLRLADIARKRREADALWLRRLETAEPREIEAPLSLADDSPEMRERVHRVINDVLASPSVS